jgi:putative FmdB family regulatory protein
MPIYEYECKNCHHRFEKLVFSFRESAPCCPQCKDEKVERLMSSGCVRPQGIPKGSGGFTPPSRPCLKTGG